MPPAAQMLPDMTGMPLSQVVTLLEVAGFSSRPATKGGYREFRHSDRSVIWIRPSGEIIRLGSRTATSSDGKRYRHRYDQHGKRTDRHSTGEVIDMGR